MPKFRVWLEVVDVYSLDVEAPDDDAAEKQMELLYENDDLSGCELKDTTHEVFRVDKLKLPSGESPAAAL
jgi:hypothetical protein